MALFVCLYRNIKGLTAALFALCHPADLLVFNQKENISFYMLLQNSKRWYTVITDETKQSKRKEKSISVLSPLFFLPGRELKENLMSFLWGNKDQKSCTQIKMQMCSSVLLRCQGRKGKHWSSWENKGSPKGTLTGNARGHVQAAHTPSNKHIKPQHLEIFVLWSWSENVLGTMRVWEIFYPASSLPAV